MKKIISVIVAACIMSAAVPLLAAEMPKEEKDQCLLASKNCATAVDSIQQKIKKLKSEIKKGKKVYSAEEIRKLEDKLNEAEALLDDLLKGSK